MLSEKIKKKIAIVALDDAADSLSSSSKKKKDFSDEDVDKVEESIETMTCPECGHEGPPNQFKD